MFRTKRTFSDATTICRRDGGTLAMPRDAETNSFLHQLQPPNRLTINCWIGLHDQRMEGKFEWVDGSPLGKYSSWYYGKQRINNGKNCVVLVMAISKTWWTDEPCNRQTAFICQVALGK
ncbi:hypothetical protein Bbelb_305720 [Branchiostoma belcheri]|nr:hypothetical protein Bbelb_305720 [Branchiostoma belcheri]